MGRGRNNKNWGAIFIGVLLLLAILVAGTALFRDRRATVAILMDSEIGDFQVVGDSQDRFEEWSFRLCWRKGNGPWIEYLLDRQGPFWPDVELERLSDLVVVKRRGDLIGSLNTLDGSFTNPLRARVESRPQRIIMSTDSPDRNKRIYPEYPVWKSVWPRIILNTK